MRVSPELFIPQTVTILNKLKKGDSITGVDVWYKKILKDCCWIVESKSEQNGTTTNVGHSVQIQIPSEQEYGYLPYGEWKENGMQTNNWTVSQNDYFVLGEITDEITSQNITSVMSKYEPNTCKVRLFDDLTMDKAFKPSSFLQKYASIYYVEGV